MDKEEPPRGTVSITKHIQIGLIREFLPWPGQEFLSGKKTMKDYWLLHVSHSVLLEVEVFIVVNCIPGPPLHIGLSVGIK